MRSFRWLGFWLLTLPFCAPVLASDERPNIVFMLVDNLGYGDLGAYGGGELRGAPTPRLDRLAGEGLRLTNFNVEPECTPSRSAFLTGRMPVRSGTSSVEVLGGLEGMTPWEYTLAELLSDAGYATALFGKWHLGHSAGRYPTDQGFDQWWGIPRSSNSPLRALQPGYDPALTGGEQPVLQGRRGDAVERVADYDLDMRRGIDNLITEKAENYIRRQAGEKRPFFLLVSFTQPHSPPLPHPDFNRPGRSDYQNTLMEIDHNAGRVLDAIDAAGITDNTLVIWASDNGPETLQGIGIQYGGQSDSGPFRGEFPSAWEGAVRVPAILRWPGRIEAGRASNEIVSILDFYATLAGFAGAGAKIPTDRPIDSIDLGDFLLGRASNSPREHVMFFYNQEMMAVKWRNYKVHFAVKVPSRSSVVAAGQGVLTAYHQTSGHPMVFDLENDPKELWNINGANQWLSSALAPVMRDYAVSLQRHPNIRPGQADGPGRR
jgi:arylsulfatase